MIPFNVLICRPFYERSLSHLSLCLCIPLLMHSFDTAFLCSPHPEITTSFCVLEDPFPSITQSCFPALLFTSCNQKLNIPVYVLGFFITPVSRCDAYRTRLINKPSIIFLKFSKLRQKRDLVHTKPLF